VFAIFLCYRLFGDLRQSSAPCDLLTSTARVIAILSHADGHEYPDRYMITLLALSCTKFVTFNPREYEL
jgi:hypothetical protein